MKLDAKAARRRVAIEGVSPEIEAGRFPVKRAAGEEVVVEADVFADGHDEIAAVLRYRHDAEAEWTEVPMQALGNDRWTAALTASELGSYRYTVEGWTDRFRTWRRDIRKWLEAGTDVSGELEVGARLAEAAAKRANGDDRKELAAWAARLRDAPTRVLTPAAADEHPALDEALATLANAYPDRRHATRYERELDVFVDSPRARFSSWYELFPRSWADVSWGGSSGGALLPPDRENRHGTFKDVIAALDYVAAMGFDVIYLPPIHPIGVTHRKGRNNARVAAAGDVGSPWAIGGEDGGHTAIHPDLGTFEDFDALVGAARELGIAIALDVAFQVSPDHPWARDHPEWFRKLPDGTIRYAENPPKRYEDIYPIDFETEDRQALWNELKGVFEFWIDRGVTVFRVDNPHTKAFPFWEWLIASLRETHPEVVLLSESFTRPRVMYRLAKVGFNQSYTYFAWRIEKWEIEEYAREVTSSPVREFFRPNFWPNTPDILTEQLQTGGDPAFRSRLVLAATLASNYGIYGPAFELMEHEPREPGSEEYLYSEKFEVKHRDLSAPGSLAPFIGTVNRIRKEHPALQHDWSLRFRNVDNDNLVAYTKDAPRDRILVVVNIDVDNTQSGWVELEDAPAGTYTAKDLLTGDEYRWEGTHNFVLLEPGRSHILQIGGVKTAPPEPPPA